MTQYALGLVETRGLVAAIEAADAMLKAARVHLVGKERTDPALITVKVVGETAAVRSAVDAGAAAAKRVGTLVSSHVIPRPAGGIEELILAAGGSLPGADDDEMMEDEAEPADETPVVKPEGMTPAQEALYDELQAMSVHELRRYARGLEGLPIHGREISRANKQELLDVLLAHRASS